MYDICDIHSHILPGMDDGCQTVEEAVAVMKLAAEGGISKMLATPHYYSGESIGDFLARREQSEALLRQRLSGETGPVPEFACGAEVAFFQGISRQEGLEKLCLGRSRYLLLELPFTPWSSEVARDVENLCLRGIQPILAHVERYFYYQDKRMIQRVLEAQPLVQMNAEYLLKSRYGRHGRKLLKKDTVQLLGSDCHGLERRPPNLGQAVACLQKKKMDAALSRVEALGDEIFREAAYGR